MIKQTFHNNHEQIINKFLVKIFSIKIESKTARAKYLEYLRDATNEIELANFYLEILIRQAEESQNKDLLELTKNESINIIDVIDRAKTLVKNLNQFFFLRELDLLEQKC